MYEVVKLGNMIYENFFLYYNNECILENATLDEVSYFISSNLAKVYALSYEK